MSKLIVYGCSFSLPFDDLFQGVEKGWPELLALELKLEYVNRAVAGSGWNNISLNIEEDILSGKISKEDLIIISPSYFQRITFPELIIEGTRQSYDLIGKYGKPQDSYVKLNIQRFCYKLHSLNEMGYRAYGWCWTPTGNRKEKTTNSNLLKYIDLLIPTPDGSLFWEDWILDNPKYMLIQGGPIKGSLDFKGDTHFSKHGHKEVSNYFKSFLLPIYN